MSTITRTVKIESVDCGTCGITFGLTSAYKAARIDDGQSFYCPNGHHIGWSAANAAERTEIQLREQLEAARSLAQREAKRARDADYRRQTPAAMRFFVLVSCPLAARPCCNRTFQNLGRHMSGQHPDYTPAEVSA